MNCRPVCFARHKQSFVKFCLLRLYISFESDYLLCQSHYGIQPSRRTADAVLLILLIASVVGSYCYFHGPLQTFRLS